MNGCQIQQSLGDVKVVLQKITAIPQKYNDKTVQKYVKKAGLQIRKVWSADEGRIRVIQDINAFIHYFDILEYCLQKTQFDLWLIFGADEVGVQLAD